MAARSKAANKLGEGGFNIELQDPKTFENTMRIVIMPDATTEDASQGTFNMLNQKETKEASALMGQSLQSDQGVVIVDS